MKRRAHIRICLFIGIALSASAGALTSDAPSRPYREIASRNSFGLKARPEKADSPPVVSPRAKIRLVGLTTILGRKMAFLVVTASEAGGLRECLVLAEGECQHEIEVAEIDAKFGIVKVLNGGQEETLGFTDNDDASPGVKPLPVPRSPGFPSGNINPVPSNPLSPGGPFGGGPQSQRSPEDQSMMIEAQRMKAIQENDPVARILPWTPHTQEIIDGMAGGAPPTPQ